MQLILILRREPNEITLNHRHFLPFLFLYRVKNNNTVFRFILLFHYFDIQVTKCTDSGDFMAFIQPD